MSNTTGSNIPANPTSQNVAALLPKLHDADSDYRFMALSDLQAMLEVGKPDFLHNDYNTAARTVDGILKTLDDQNGEVQNTAMKCLAPLVEKLPSSILAPLIEKLSTLRPENAVDNSIPATALRTVVITLPRPVAGVSPGIDVNEAYSAISRVLIPRLVGRLVVAPPAMSDKYLNKPSIKLPHPPQGMLELDANKEVDPEAVDILVEVVRCFGPLLQRPEVEALQGLLVGILDSDRTSSIVKKRAVVAVSVLAIYLPDQALSDFVSTLIESLRNPHNTPVQRKLYITILGSMARSIPARFGPYLKTLAPFVLSALSEQELEEQRENAAEDGERDPEIDDVREAALGALDGFLASCGSEMRAYTEESISAALLFLKYDPNYNDDDDDEEMGGTQPDEDDMDEFDDDEDFEQEAGYDDDDDDPSWKVRRCAAKTLYTLISTRGAGDLLDDGTLYREVAPMLVQRFNEREEHVRLEVITTLASLIRKTGGGIMINFSTDEGADYMSPAPQSRKRRRESSTSFDTKSFLSLSAGLTSPTLEPIPLSGPKADLAKLSPQIIKVTAKLLKTSSIATKQALISMLDDMIAVQHGGLSDHLSQLIDPIIEAIKNSSGGVNSSTTVGGSTTVNSGTLRIAALRFIGNVSKTHSSKILQPYLNKIIPGVVSAVNDRNYKISSEAIGTVEQFVKALTPPRSRSTQDHKSDFQKLYQIILDRVTATDADVEVRERAIHALGILLARTANAEGSTLLSSADRTAALDTVNDRLKNETTRLAAVRAIDTIAALSTSKDQLQPKWIREVSLELSAQLRKANRSLRGASLGALKNLVLAPASRKALDAETIQGLVSALLPLITASDLHMLGPALLVLAALVSDDAKLVVSDQLNTALSGLLVSPLGGSVLDALLVLVTNIGQAGVGQQLMATLLEQVGVRGDPAAVGKVIGTLLVYGGASVGVSLDSFLAELKNPQSNEAAKSLALSVLGEAGLRLEGKSPLKPSIFFEQFESQSDKVPLAAAIALGRAGAGNIPVFLPEILSHMTKGGSSQYLFLHSIKEILQQAGTTSSDINTYSQTIWGKLLVACKPEENKAVGAECIGRLVIIDPRVYMPQLQTILRDKDASLRALVIQAVRYTLPETDETFDAVLKTTLIDMLQVMVHDNEIENRRLALTTLNAAAHNKPDLILPHLGQLLPLVIQESIIKPELIREVTMGPFKHKIDDGLELRKSAYETLYSLMEIAFSRISILDLYDRVIAGLQDEHDIRQLCNLMLSKLVHLDPDETARRLDALAGCFRSILMIKLKDNAVKQDVEKQDEAVRSALRITLLLHNAIPSASGTMAAQGMQHQTWRDYWEWVEKDFEVQLRALKDESKE